MQGFVKCGGVQGRAWIADYAVDAGWVERMEEGGMSHHVLARGNVYGCTRLTVEALSGELCNEIINQVPLTKSLGHEQGCEGGMYIWLRPPFSLQSNTHPFKVVKSIINSKYHISTSSFSSESQEHQSWHLQEE